MGIVSDKDVEILIKEMLADENFETVLHILFSKDATVVKDDFISGLRKIASLKFGKKYDAYFEKLSEDTNEVGRFLETMSDYICKKYFPGENTEIKIVTIDEFRIWILYAISIKKCLGINYSKEKLTERQYYNELKETINQEQRNAHSQCVLGFSHDSCDFTFKKDPFLNVFLHHFHGKNKARKTKKKNIRRVIKQAERYAILHKLNHRNKSIFDRGKYLVPRQFGETIIKIYLL